MQLLFTDATTDIGLTKKMAKGADRYIWDKVAKCIWYEELHSFDAARKWDSRLVLAAASPGATLSTNESIRIPRFVGVF